MRVALASCRQIPEPDVDEPLLVAALRTRGVDAKVLAWDDPSAPFASQDLVVLRSTWNYFEDRDAFVAWTAKIARLANPASIVRVNTDKTYLRDLASRGVDVIPTEYVARGEHGKLEELLARRGWSEVVIKPAISAGSFRTQRFAATRAAEGQAFLDALTQERTAMVQEWMPSVEGYGERSLVWIDGAFTHAIRKSPRFIGGVEEVSDAVPIADDERVVGERAIAAARAWKADDGDLLYGRVDVVRDPRGVVRVMELELVEPSLFLKQSPAALDRFADAIAARAGQTG